MAKTPGSPPPAGRKPTAPPEPPSGPTLLELALERLPDWLDPKGRLSPAERRPTRSERTMIERAGRGRPFVAPGFHPLQNDPAQSAEWGPERTVRAGVVSWLCRDPEARSRIPGFGVQAAGIRIEGRLDLTGAGFGRTLAFGGCHLPGGMLLTDARLEGLLLDGSITGPILADRLKVERDAYFRDGFKSAGEVRLQGAIIGGTLDCRGAEFHNEGKLDHGLPRKALNAPKIRTGGDLALNAGFSAHGEVRLTGAIVGGNLDCEGGRFSDPLKGAARGHGTALNADRVKVKGSVLLRRGFHAEGEVRLLGAAIGGDLDCQGGAFLNPGRDEHGHAKNALTAVRMKAGGKALLRGGFKAAGAVRLAGAAIGGDLDCAGGEFHNVGGYALFADGMKVEGAVHLRRGCVFDGRISLVVAKLAGGLEVRGANDLGKAMIDLRGARIRAIRIGGDEGPESDRAYLQALVYDSKGKQATPRPDWWIEFVAKK